LTMTELTAAQVLALSALAEGRPMTTAELTRAVADMGMHLGEDYAAATVRSLTEQGMAERTRRPAWASTRSRHTAGRGSPPTPRLRRAKAETRRGREPLRNLRSRSVGG
jgi:predicted deacylase